MLSGNLYEETREDEVLVGTSSVIVSPARQTTPKRKIILIRNNSANVADIIYIAFGQKKAIADKGIILKIGESFSDSTDSGYECYQDQINAICATANGKLAVFER